MPRNPHIEAILRDRYSGRRKVPKPTRQADPRGLERSYLRDIINLLEPAQRLVEELLIPRLPEFDAEITIDAYPEAIESIFGDITLRYGQIIGAGTIKGVAADQAGQLDLFNRKQTSRQFKRILGIDVFSLTPELTTEISAFTVDNVKLIESVSTRYFQQIENTVLRNLRAGNRFAEWEDELPKLDDKARSSAALIARDQTNKFNGELNHTRQTSLGIRGYTWRTSLDERVRETHLDLEGERFAWEGEPKPPEGHPGEPVLCRCQSEPDVEGTLSDLGVEGAPPPEIDTSKEDVAAVRRKKAEMRESDRLKRESKRKAISKKVPGRPFKQSTSSQRPANPEQAEIFDSVDHWVHGSRSKGAVTLKLAVKEELGGKLGLEGIAFTRRQLNISNQSVVQARGVARRMYSQTQKQLREQGIREMTLYRGVKDNYSVPGVAESWTTDIRTAKKFAGSKGRVIVKEVPASKILNGIGMDHWHDGKFGNQSEWMVLR